MSVTRFALTLFAITLGLTPGRAQQTATAQVSGTVQDPIGAAVPSASVRMIQTDTGLARFATAGPDGSYTILL